MLLILILILLDGAYFLLAVMVEGDESSWQFCQLPALILTVLGKINLKLNHYLT